MFAIPSAIFDRVLQASWQAGVIALIVLMLQLVLGRWLPAWWRSALWLIVFVRLILPALPPSPWHVSADHARPIATAASFADQVTVRFGIIRGGDAPTLDGPNQAPAPSIRTNWKDAAAACWLIVALLLLVRAIVGPVRFSRRIAHLPATTDPRVLEAMDDCIRKLSSARPRIVETNLVSSPALTGLFRSTLLLPPGLTNVLTPIQLRFAVLHELVHAKRRDVFVGWLITWVAAMHWFNPLVLLAAARWRADRELACDAAVLATTGDSVEYGIAILQMLERFTAAVPSPAVGLISSRRTIHRRIDACARFRRPSRFAGIVSGFVLVAVALLTLTTPRRVALGAPPPSTTSDGSVVTRIYNVADLIIPIPNFTNAPDLGIVRPHKPVRPPTTQIVETRDSRMDNLVKFIGQIDPASWKSNGGAGVLATDIKAGTLTITQSSRVHELIADQLTSMGEVRGVQITLETRFLTRESLGEELSRIDPKGKWQPAQDHEAWSNYLDDAQVKDLLTAAQKDEQSWLITAPRLTVFNGQRAYVLVSRQTAFVGDFIKKTASTQPGGLEPEIDLATSGILIDCQATASKDRKSANITFRPQLSTLMDLVSQEYPNSPPGMHYMIQVPHLSQIKLNTTLEIPDLHTAALIVRSRQPATAPKRYETVILLKPKVILNKPPGTTRPASS